MKKIKVLIVDDSLSIRLLLNGIFSSAADMDVAGMAANPMEAMEKLKSINPDVVTLDVEMPGMDGITFLGKIMKLRPLPVVMISTLTASGSATAVRALELGAMDVVGKPSHKATELESYQDEILTKVRAAAYARIGNRQPPPPPPPSALNTISVAKTLLIDDVLPRQNRPPPVQAAPLIAIGASTGGPEALRLLLAELSVGLPPILIVQHMAAGFTTALAKSLDTKTELTVEEAADGRPLQRNHVYLAPGGKHLGVRRTTSGAYTCEIMDLPAVNRHRPAVDILFRTAAQAAGKAATGVLLTGMGDDGARCLKELRTGGALTIAQDEASCTVYGMPRAAARMDAAEHILGLSAIAKKLKEIKA